MCRKHPHQVPVTACHNQPPACSSTHATILLLSWFLGVRNLGTSRGWSQMGDEQRAGARLAGTDVSPRGLSLHRGLSCGPAVASFLGGGFRALGCFCGEPWSGARAAGSGVG